MRSMSSLTLGISWLLSAFILTSTSAAQTSKPFSQDHAILYKRAVSILDQAEKKFNARSLSEAKSAVKEANALFTILQQDLKPVLAERLLTPNEEQQFSVNEKLANDAQAQADRLSASAAVHKKKGQELEAQGREAASKDSYRRSKDDYNRAQSLYVRAAIYSLRNQQMIFRFLVPGAP